jgi:ssDNA-binding Zn-finger/Zn-ribbon topoisomerase 1
MAQPTCPKCGKKMVIRKVNSNFDEGQFTIKGELVIPKKGTNKISDRKVEKSSGWIYPKCG